MLCLKIREVGSSLEHALGENRSATVHKASDSVKSRKEAEGDVLRKRSFLACQQSKLLSSTFGASALLTKISWFKASCAQKR